MRMATALDTSMHRLESEESPSVLILPLHSTGKKASLMGSYSHGYGHWDGTWNDIKASSRHFMNVYIYLPIYYE